MSSGGNLTLIVILLILWFVGIFLAGYFGYKHFDEHKKSETNLILFVLGVILAIGTFIGIIILFVKRSRMPKKTKASDVTSDTGDMGYNLPPGYPPGYESAPLMAPGYGQSMQLPTYGQGFQPTPSGYGPGFQSMPSASGFQSITTPAPYGYPSSNPYLAQQYSI